MKRLHLAALFLGLFAAPAIAEIRVDRFDAAYNAAADEVGSGLRLRVDRCERSLCFYAGDRGATADVSAPAAGRAIDGALLRLPAGFGPSEVAAVFDTFVLAVAPDSSVGQRSTFLSGLYEQLTAHGARAEGHFRGWTFVLRDDGDQLRIIASK